MQDDLIVERLGAWEAWAGEESTWPVTRLGAKVVEWALRVHRTYFGDGTLKRALAEDPPHPFVEQGRWPLTNVHAVLELLCRACTLSLLGADARAAIVERWQAPDINRIIRSDLDVLEVAGWALADGWSAEFESKLPSGRRPDLLLRREEEHLCVEVTNVGPDRVLRAAERWSQAVVAALSAIGSRHGVDISGSADSTDLQGTAQEQFIRDVDMEAARVASSGHVAEMRSRDVLVTISPNGSGLSSFDGPPLDGDMWPRLESRLKEKARQTDGTTQAWILMQDRSHLFRITDLAAVSEAEQLRRLAHNTAIVMREYPHVAGVVLSTGVRIDSGEVDQETHLHASDLESPVQSASVIRRRLPGGRCRRSFIIDLGCSQTSLDAPPRRWLESEGGRLA